MNKIHNEETLVDIYRNLTRGSAASSSSSSSSSHNLNNNNDNNNSNNLLYKWYEQLIDLNNLKQIDFIWINNDYILFEWFIQLLTQLSLNDIKNGIKINSYIFISTIHNRKFVKMKNINNNNNNDDDDDRNILLKLNPGLPNMEKLFEKLSKDKKGKVNLFY